MILQISDNDSLIIRCHTFDNMPTMQDFYLSIHENYLYISRNSGEEIKVHLGKSGKTYFPSKANTDGKNNFSEIIKSKPLKRGVVLIKLEKE